MTNIFQVIMLASGSKGNAAVISLASRRFLVDMGLSVRELKKRAASVGIRLEELDAVLITHEHIDHIKGLETFLKKYKTPVYASHRTWLEIFKRFPDLDRRRCSLLETNLFCGGVRIGSFSVPHDAVDTRGYTFTDVASGAKCAYLTDVGYITETIKEALEGSEVLVLEANHDVEMLKEGPYPRELKQRILSTRGHLSNASAGAYLAGLKTLPKQVFLAHLSEQNNLPRLAYDTVAGALTGRLDETDILVASQTEVVLAGGRPEQLKIFD